MIDGPRDLIWLSGERFNLDYLFDVESGTVVHKLVSPARVGMTAGMGRTMGGRFVAVYVAPNCAGLVVQVDARRFALDGLTRASHSRRWRGLVSELLLQREGEPDLTVSQWTVAAALLRRADPAYDALDESMDDFLADVADIANSEYRQSWILKVKDPSAGPWEAVA
jgi:hypothetical protein